MKQTIIPGPPRPASQFTWNWLCCFKSQACKVKTIWMTTKHGWKMKANNHADYINIVSFRCQDYIYTLTNQRWTHMKTHSACLDPVTAWRAAFEIDPWTYFWERTFLDVSFQWLSCLNLAGFQSKSNLYIRKLPSSKVKDLENYDKKKWNSNIGSSILDLNDGSGERHPQSLLFSSLEIPLVACEQRTSKNHYEQFRLVFFSEFFFHFTRGVFRCGAAWSWMSLHRSIDFAWPRSLHQVTMEDGRMWRMWRMWTVRMLSCLCCATHRHQVVLPGQLGWNNAQICQSQHFLIPEMKHDSVWVTHGNASSWTGIEIGCVAWLVLDFTKRISHKLLKHRAEMHLATTCKFHFGINLP